MITASPTRFSIASQIAAIKRCCGLIFICQTIKSSLNMMGNNILAPFNLEALRRSKRRQIFIICRDATVSKMHIVSPMILK